MHNQEGKEKVVQIDLATYCHLLPTALETNCPFAKVPNMSLICP